MQAALPQKWIMSLKVNNAESRRYRSRTTAERRTERRDKLIEAATEAFASDGYSNTSIEQLCSMAGISARNFYEEFGSKEELLHALYDDINVRAIEAAASSLAKADPLDFKARAGAGVTAYLKTMTADRRMARIAHIESVGVSAAMEAHRQAALNVFASLIKQEADRLAKIKLAPKRDFSLTAIALVGAIRGLAVASVTPGDKPQSLEKIAAEATHLIVAAILQSPA
ncbi:TetR/AcrR family transcriptional regulator [Rhodanobacter sp. MP1X3]|uniref:TetR/AcrR family transcriptional regulator n=1 Tax=Rhodanobacter sp. MP1X3 TaxID=2723086 RepID=UPI0016183786|nr:TetR/AcrR family transcriptional regulator [Rhodanobacter sp. MP1X3]MBB6241488.1 AcrR family transcriptional regulator [Rhodanobacter sp. MP1X3]